EPVLTAAVVTAGVTRLRRSWQVVVGCSSKGRARSVGPFSCSPPPRRVALQERGFSSLPPSANSLPCKHSGAACTKCRMAQCSILIGRAFVYFELGLRARRE